MAYVWSCGLLLPLKNVFLLAASPGLWDLSSPTRDWTLPWRRGVLTTGPPGKSLENFLKEAFPGGPVVKNLPAFAGDMGSVPGLGRLHMLWSNQACVPQLPNWALELVLRNKRRHCDGKPVYRSEE